MIRRIFGSLLIFISVLFFPYWVYVPLLFIGIIFFPFFWEGIILALIIDFIHGAGLWGPSLLFTSFGFYVLISLIILLPIRERLRTYA